MMKTYDIIFQFFIHLTSFAVVILVKFYCFTSPFVPSRCQRCRGRLVPRSAATPLVKGAHLNWLGKLSSMTALPETCQNSLTLQWRHNGRDSVSNNQPHDCLLNRLFRCRSKKTSQFRVTGLCAGNSPETGEFPAQMASNAENVFIWWRHHEISPTYSLTKTPW